MNALTNLTGVGGGPGAIGMGPRPTGAPVGGMGAMGPMQIGQHAMAGVAGNPQAKDTALQEARRTIENQRGEIANLKKRVDQLTEERNFLRERLKEEEKTVMQASALMKEESEEIDSEADTEPSEDTNARKKIKSKVKSKFEPKKIKRRKCE
ncbi:mediator of RNA polymerase II transcription subunit 15-like isoform X2 [Mastacembelus armatus]|nr:mediator of RNA polymerase II transcription subunit 15-like isoform X2 [Mastacembelus armatus]